MQEWAKVDVILMACNVVQAARQVDTQQLNTIRHYFHEQCPNQALPVIIVVATHCDRLRPIREWKPPYNIQQPDNAKAHSIRQACEAIAHDLSVSLDCIVPVCLSPEKPAYNIEDGLIPVRQAKLVISCKVKVLAWNSKE